jgi:hypothetical protein
MWEYHKASKFKVCASFDHKSIFPLFVDYANVQQKVHKGSNTQNDVV